ncbi:MAG: hypothetical protein COA47_08115 [Robiginitomaculum sp.]|nr:MAG: hypothetical protein COA47_08115 [Robiginitomaculum sp.]
MAGNGPWSVKGIDPKARAAAKEAAQRNGMTLGEWLSNKMLEPENLSHTRNEPSTTRNEYAGSSRRGGHEVASAPVRGDHRQPGDDWIFSEIEGLARRLEATEQRSTLAITGIDQSVLGMLSRVERVETVQTEVNDRLAQSLDTLDVRLAQMDQSMDEHSVRYSRQLDDAARRIDTIGEQGDTTNSALRHEVGKDVELINTRSDEISQRLAQAEKQTDNAIRTLEASFVNLDERLRGTENSIDQNSDSGLSEKFDRQFSQISNELVKVVAETRGQLAAQIEAHAANPKLGQVEDGLAHVRRKFASTENRHANTLEQIALAVSKLGSAVENRLRESEQRSDTRLDTLRQDQATALDKVGQSMAEVVERLEARFDQAEESKTAENDLESRLRESEHRTGQLVEEALQRVHQRLDETQSEETDSDSPVQRALENLTERLAAIEDRSTPPFADPNNDQSRAASTHATPDNFENDPAASELVAPPAPENTHHYAQNPEPFDQPGLPSLGDGGDFGAPIDYVPEELPELYAEHYQNNAVNPDQPVGATANQAFMDAARRSVLESAQAAARAPAYPAGSPVPGLSAQSNPENKKDNRKMLVAASVFALVAIGAAATVTLLDLGGNNASGPPMAQQEMDGGTGNDQFLYGSNQSGGAATETDSAAQDQPMAPPIDQNEPEPVRVAAITPLPGVKDPVVTQKPVISKPARTTPRPQAQVPVTRVATVTPRPSSRPVQQASIAPTISQDPNEPISLGHTAPKTNERPSMEQAAAAGDPVAQYQYAGSLLDAGQEVRAAKVMQQAAEKGLPAAQYQLAKYFENGTGLPIDERAARRWTERAANGGNRRAMHNLAMYYAEGRGTTQSYENAAKWFEEAALLGLTNSQFNLALLYEQGLGLPKSLPDAYAWYSIASKAGDRGAGGKLLELKKQLPADAISEAGIITARFRPRPLDLAAQGTFRNINWARNQLDNPATISRSQILLARLGYQPGPADGSVGEKTRLAVIAYERDNGLAQTGRIDGALLSKLERATVN